MKLCITCSDRGRLHAARRCADQTGVTLVDAPPSDCIYELAFTEQDVRLRHLGARQGDIVVDFCGGSAAHRRRYGGGKGQLIAKAVGLKSGAKPHVYDMTAGLGGDAFVLAGLGCKVTMVERNPVVYALLSDGLERARKFAEQADAELAEVLQRMHLINADAVKWMRGTAEKLPVVYLDPMFPERRKSASVKKDMQAFHALVGEDGDADALLQTALKVVVHRVVVKRPRTAPALGGEAPAYTLEGKSSRYDVYSFRRLGSPHA